MVLETLREMKPALQARFHLRSLGLFGSIARGDHDDKSDVDILVEYTKTISLFDVVELHDILQAKLNRHVEVVSENRIKESLKKYILKDVIYL